MTGAAPSLGSGNRLAWSAAGTAAMVGLAYAGVSAYWGSGGTALIGTVGGTLERQGLAHDSLLLAVVWVSVVLKLVAAALGLLAIGLRDRQRRRWTRVLGWVAAGILTVYGGVLTAVGLAVQADLLHASAGADHRALRWHAFLWDPWFLGWGLLLVVALTASSVRRRSG
jgi:hypothetical protein